MLPCYPGFWASGQRHNGHEVLNTLTQSTPLGLTRCFSISFEVLVKLKPGFVWHWARKMQVWSVSTVIHGTNLYFANYQLTRATYFYANDLAIMAKRLGMNWVGMGLGELGLWAGEGIII